MIHNFKKAFGPFFLCLLLLSSCGTIRSKKNIIFADSSPRGLQVVNEQNELLGTTPFFFKVRPGGKREFKYLDKEQNVGKVIYRCKWDWGGSVVPNLLWSPAVPVGTILSGIFIFTDFSSKGLYVCKDSLFLETQGAGPEAKKKEVILGMPIAIGERGLAEKIVSFWKKEFFEKEKTSETFLWNEEVENEFIYRGVDLFADTNPTKVKRRFINQIGKKFKGTHLLHFDLKEEDDFYLITPKLYDAFTFEQVEKDYLKPFKMKKEKKTAKNYWRRVLRNIDLLPNAVTLSYHSKPKETREVALDISQNGEFETNNHPQAFPKLITMFGVETVRHPQFFDNWDWGGFLSPNFGASSWRSAFKINQEDYFFDFQSYLFGYNASATGFSPLGQVSIGIGINMGYFILSDSRGFKSQTAGLLLGTNVNYSKFFNDRFYLTLGVKNYSPSKTVTGKSEYTLKSWNEYYLGLGYYFPEVKTFARKLIGL